MTVLLATSAALPGLAPDDRYLLRALRALGVSAQPAVWEDPHLDWASARACVIRSTWDYAYRRAAFLAWLRRVASGTPVWNPPDVIDWNTHKGYLLDLAAKGVPIVPTLVLPAGPPDRLNGLLSRLGCDEVIIKAAVAQTGRYLLHVPPGGGANGQRHLDRLQPHEDLLVQPFLPGVMTEGETSVVYLDGAVSHVVRKRPGTGDFRVHDDYGGTLQASTATREELDVAARAVAVVDHPLLYARVDLVPGPEGPVVMELELVEPDLYFEHGAGAAERLAHAIIGRLAS